VGRIKQASLATVAGVVLYVGASGTAAGTERDLYSGLAYLRAGAQSEAERSLTRYRDEEPDAEIRRKVDLVLPLLKRTLTQEVRDYIAATIEEAVSSRSSLRFETRRPSYWSRMFPVFH
jgi:hypothetical protein